MCISGDVTRLNDEQWHLIDSGMEFYREIVPIIREGQSYHYGTKIKSLRHPKGWQSLVRVGKNGRAYLVLHVFELERSKGGSDKEDVQEKLQISLPAGCPERITRIYSEQEENIRIKEHCVEYTMKESRKALAVLLG